MKIIKFILTLIIINFTYTTHAYSANKNIIYVYADEGTGKISLEHTLYTLNKIFGNSYKIETIKAKEVLNGKWAKKASLFVMPGGADIPYTKKLNGRGNKIIKRFVENGGSYLGICAGAYYGSGYVEFDKGGKLEVVGTRELSFFPGKSIGPILASYDYKSNKGARLAKIETHVDSINKVNLYFNGGGFFEDIDNYSNISILGEYNKQKNGKKLPAIIYIKYGKGNVVLSGVHFEFEPSLLNKQDPYLSKIILGLEKDSIHRYKLIKEIFHRLKISLI